MSMFGVFLFVLLSISCWRPYGAENPSCMPTVRDEPFTQFMESRNCEVDENLLRLFSSEEFNNSIVNNMYANFMCVGLMDALGLIPENICDVFDPLGEIPDADFCSSSKIATLRKVVNGSVFDNTSNIFIVSKFTEEHCEAVCKDETNQLCWAFGIVSRVTLKYTQSTQAPTTVATTTTAPQLSTVRVLPALIAQDDVAPINSNVGDVDNGDSDSKGGSDDHTDKPENFTDENITDYFDKKKVSNSSDNVYDMPDANNDDDTKESDDGDANTDDIDGGKGGDEVHTDKPEDNDNTPTVTTSTIDNNVADYFEVSNNSESIKIIPDTNNDDNVDSIYEDTNSKGGNDDPTDKPEYNGHTDKAEDNDNTPTVTTSTSDDNVTEYFDKLNKVNNRSENDNNGVKENSENKETDTEEQAPTEVVPTVDQDWLDIDDSQAHPLGDVQGDDTDQAADHDDQEDHTDQAYDYSDRSDGNDVPSTSTTPVPTNHEAITTSYLANGYDYVDYDHDYGSYGVVDDGDGSGYQYLMAILLLIFLLVAAEYLAAHKIKELLPANTSESRGEYMPVDTMEAGLS